MNTQNNLTPKQHRIFALANKIKSFGYNVYLSERNEYGFFTDNESKRLVSFQIDYFFFNFSSNHKSINLGSGVRLTNDEKCIEWDIDTWCTYDFLKSLMTSKPYISKRKKEKFISWTTLQEHMEIYNSSSKYHLI